MYIYIYELYIYIYVCNIYIYIYIYIYIVYIISYIHIIIYIQYIYIYICTHRQSWINLGRPKRLGDADPFPFRLRVAAMPQSHWDEHIVTG